MYFSNHTQPPLLLILEQVFSIFTIWISWEFFKYLSSDFTLFNNFISLFRTLLQAVSSNQAPPSKHCLAISDKTSNFLTYKVYLPQTLEHSSTKSFANLWGGSPFLHCLITWFSFTSWPSPEFPYHLFRLACHSSSRHCPLSTSKAAFTFLVICYSSTLLLGTKIYSSQPELLWHNATDWVA